MISKTTNKMILIFLLIIVFHEISKFILKIRIQLIFSILNQRFYETPLEFYSQSNIIQAEFLHIFCVIMALRPSGFVEYSPSEQRIFDQLISEIQNQFQLF
jgi:hypothetical protein